MTVSLAPSAPGAGSTIDIVYPAAQPAGEVTGGRRLADTAAAEGTLAPSAVRTSSTGAGQLPPATVEINIGGVTGELESMVASHLEGLTVQQMLDLDIDALAVKIDKHQCHTKKAVLDHFMETKARLMQSQNDAVDEERRLGLARLAAKEEELTLVKGELEAMRLKAQRVWEMLGRSCAAYGVAKERRRRMMLAFQVFYAWREQAMALRRRKLRAERAERWYSEVHLKRNVFRAWFRVAMREHRVTVNNRYIQEVENAKRLIHEHYQGQLADLERMLADAHAQLEREAEARNRLEDNMKRAFMRGVCALNIEAMNVMKRGAPPGGANPFPMNLPPAPPPPPQQQQQAPPQPPQQQQAQQQQQQQQAAAMGALLEAGINMDFRGSVTLSPTRLPPSAAAAAAVASTAPAAAAAPYGAPSGLPATTVTGAVRLSGGLGGVQGYAVGPSGGAVNRPGSAGAGGNPLVVKGPTAMPAAGTIPPATGAAAAPGAGAIGGADGPLPRETAQAFYQRPQVVVTRGPSGAGNAGASDAPRPRVSAPLPTVRML